MKILSFIALIAMLSLCSCQKEEADPCESVFCENDGTCIDGECICQLGYTGFNCEEERTPLEVVITRVSINKMPITNNGVSWDPLGDAADPTFTIEQGGNIVYDLQGFYEDALVFPISWDIYASLSPAATFVLRLFDHDDFSAPDFIALLGRATYIKGEGFPEEITLTDGSTEVILRLTYIYA